MKTGGGCSGCGGGVVVVVVVVVVVAVVVIVLRKHFDCKDCQKGSVYLLSVYRCGRKT